MTAARPWAAVEFIGLPGVGKSTLAHRTAELLQQRGWAVEESTYRTDHELRAWARYLFKFRLIAAQTIVHPIDAMRSVQAILATRQASVPDFVGVVVNWLFVSSLLRRAGGREGLHVFDEGVINTLWSIAFGAHSPRIVEILGGLAARRGTRMTLVVSVEADVATIQARLRRRPVGWSRLERLAPETEAWDRAMRAMQQVQDTLQRRIDPAGTLRIVPVRNEESDDPDVLAHRLVAALEALLRPELATVLVNEDPDGGQGADHGQRREDHLREG